MALVTIAPVVREGGRGGVGWFEWFTAGEQQYSKLVINHIAMEICRNIVPVWQLRILIAVMMRTPNDG